MLYLRSKEINLIPALFNSSICICLYASQPGWAKSIRAINSFLGNGCRFHSLAIRPTLYALEENLFLISVTGDTHKCALYRSSNGSLFFFNASICVGSLPS